MNDIYLCLSVPFFAVGFDSASKARLKSSISSEASTLCAISTKRLWRSASVSFGFGSLFAFGFALGAFAMGWPFSDKSFDR